MTYLNYERNSGSDHRLDHSATDRSVSPSTHHVQLIEPRTEVEGERNTALTLTFTEHLIY